MMDSFNEAEMKDVLTGLQRANPNNMQVAIRKEILRNPTFRERLYYMLEAGFFETIKVFFPPSSITIEMIKGWKEAKPFNPTEDRLPPGGFCSPLERSLKTFKLHRTGSILHG